MPRPQQKTIQLTIDGREVQAAEGTMLVDAAKQGDVEIPYFCYHAKLGQPVGACRMCLVEIEGIPKLQTSCSTPVKDGMVVHTQTERVHHAQNAVVEFLLVNHPLDCPVRDEKVMRVLARDPGHEGVDDGWLCDKGRFAYQAIHVDERITTPLVRDGGELRAVSWERALQTAAGLARHRGRVGALAGGQATNEEGFLLGRLMRESLESGDLDCRVGGAPDLHTARALAGPKIQATVPDLEYAHTVLVVGCEPLDDAPILDLRIRKGVRRRGVQLAVATARPSALDANANVGVRYEPGQEADF